MFTESLERTVYFCCLQVLPKAAKHAGPGASATVRLSDDRSGVHFSVVDDGVGCDPKAVEGTGGLMNLADRTTAAGGTLQIESAPGRGARVEGWILV
jgi:signal transduction histidine kinase